VGLDTAITADHNVRTDDRVGADRSIGADPGISIDDGGGVYSRRTVLREKSGCPGKSQFGIRMQQQRLGSIALCSTAKNRRSRRRESCSQSLWLGSKHQ